MGRENLNMALNIKGDQDSIPDLAVTNFVTLGKLITSGAEGVLGFLQN